MSDPLFQLAGAAQTPLQAGSQAGGSQGRLTGEQIQSVRQILSEFDPNDSSAEDLGAINGALRAEGIRPSGALRDVLVAEGFDPTALAAAANGDSGARGTVPARAEIVPPSRPTSPPETIQTFLSALTDALGQFDDGLGDNPDAQRSVVSAMLAQGFQIRGNINQLA